MKHAPFHIGFIWAALGAAIGAGFPIAAHLSFVIGLGFPVGPGFVSFIQTHGHVQLIGWTGLFIMGISLHFMPRLAGVPIAKPQRIKHILWLMSSGLVLRTVGHAILPYLVSRPMFHPVAVMMALSGVFEAAGILSYVGLLVFTLLRVGDDPVRPALQAVRPYVRMMLIGWSLYTDLNLVLLVHMALGKAVVLHGAWNQFGIELFIGFVLLPVTFAVSVRTFPLYLRLPAPDALVRLIGCFYVVALSLRVLPMMPLLPAEPHLLAFLSGFGTLLRAGVMLWFVWQLDVLTRRRQPWTVHRVLQPGPERRPTRPGLPDYGEFGCFDRLIVAAYVWLVVAAVSDGLSGMATLAGKTWFIGDGAIRHLYLAGFVNLLILGMAVRMVPGFLRKRQVASPASVEATFWLGNAAVLCRVLLFVVPPALLETLPGLLLGARLAFALSGILGLAAAGCLGMNLWKTARGA